MRTVLDRVFGKYRERTAAQLAALLLAAAALQTSGGVGAAYLAGFTEVDHVLRHVQWAYLVALAGTLAVSFVGYYYAYCGIYQVEDGRKLRPAQMRSVVIAGFGSFLAHGGAAIDHFALQAAGADEREAKVRTVALDGMEHGVMSLIGQVAAVILLVAGIAAPPLDFQVPWAVLPLPGFLIAFRLSARYRDEHRDAPGWRGKLGVFWDAVHLVDELFRHPVRQLSAWSGMTLFWLAEMASGWLGMAAFGYHMGIAQYVVGFGTGMVFTRRTGPFAGAGVLELVLPLTIWASGAPFAVAVVGMFTYRAVTVWLPVPFALERMPQVRRLGRRPAPGTGRKPGDEGEPALRKTG